VPQFVGVETGNSELFGCASEHRPLKDLCAEGAAPLTAEDEVIRQSARDVSGQIINQEAGERHLPAFVAFGVPQICTPRTSVTDSETVARRRIRSSRPTRNAAISPKRTPV
jgi:hypothetical protein